jgi:hypothetical protein
MNREKWLALRKTDLRALRDRIYVWIMKVPAGGRTKDPARHTAHRRWKGRPLATGPGSYREASPADIRRQERAR